MPIAHAIDLALQVKGIKEGSTISFYGEYEWSSKGGVIHWTHHDPQEQYEHGRLIHNSRDMISLPIWPPGKT